MVWEWAAYMAIAAGVAFVAAIVAAAVAIWRLLRRWDASIERLDREAEATLRQWRKLGQEASETVELCRRSLQGFESLAEGGRSLGEAAQTIARTASRTAIQWTERVSDKLAETEERQMRRLEEALDWTDVGLHLWNAWRRRVANAFSPASEATAEHADEKR